MVTTDTDTRTTADVLSSIDRMVTQLTARRAVIDAQLTNLETWRMEMEPIISALETSEAATPRQDDRF